MRHKLALAAFVALPALAQVIPADPQSKKSEPDQARKEEIAIDFADEPSKEDEDGTFFAAPIEQIFKNPAIVSGLASGADALNRSVESLMDALFYGLLDNEFNIPLTDRWRFSTNLRRDVFSTPNGSYVVVDRIELGPRYAQELWRAHEIPVSLGLDGSVELLEIYMRTDGMRLAEQRALPTWRRWVNNWFGLLPILTAVLPPSFNQNELYDPLRQLQGPLSLPLTAATFYEMPIGSIRSYGLTGGVNLPIDLGQTLPDDVAKNLDRAGGLRHSVPYTIFKRGEHRINVLRRGEHIAWVGLKDLNRTGHKLSPLVGNKPEIFAGALAARIYKWKWVWGGVPVALFPIDVEFEQALAKIYDQVYEYDLRNPHARQAYEAAVKGDFAPSRFKHLDRVEKKLDTGVTFHFTRVQDRQESNIRNSPNLAVFRKERHRDRFSGEVEVTDAEGKFYILETQQDTADKTWDVFVGEEETRIRSLVELKVRRVINKDAPEDESQFYYAFEAEPNPMTLTISMAINDRFINVVEYREYLEQLRFFTKMPLLDVPDLPLRDPARVDAGWRKAYYVEPDREAVTLHVTPQHLGGFGAQALISLGTEQIERIVNTPEDEMWRSFARAFGVDPTPWGVARQRESLRHQLKWFNAFFLYPLKLFHIRIPAADVIHEADSGVRQLLAIRDMKEPIQRLDAFYQLVDSDHPLRVTRALLDLANASKVPRRVHFTVQPKGSSSQQTKARYGGLNNKIFRAGPAMPDPGRYQLAQQKMAAFYLDQPRDAEQKPSVSRILVTTKAVPSSLRGLPYTSGDGGVDRGQHVFVTFTCQNVTRETPLKLFIRVEQAGKVKLGKLHLAEQVIDVTPIDAIADGDPSTLVYEFFLTGPLSPISNFIFDESVRSGDQLLVTLAISSDGNIWSAERQLEFRFENGALMKPE